jgi:hypothetical protein
MADMMMLYDPRADNSRRPPSDVKTSSRACTISYARSWHQAAATARYAALKPLQHIAFCRALDECTHVSAHTRTRTGPYMLLPVNLT